MEQVLPASNGAKNIAFVICYEKNQELFQCL